MVYIPWSGYVGSDSFSFTANDGYHFSNTATVYLNVTYSAVTADSQQLTTAEDTPLPLTLTASDTENDPLTYTILTYPQYGSLTGDAPNLIYTPGPDYYGSDSFTFTASDGVHISQPATISISVMDDGLPPPVVQLRAVDRQASEQGPASGRLVVTRETEDLQWPLVVYYGVSGTATAGDDCAALPWSVTIPAGETTAEIEIAPVDDALPELQESVRLELYSWSTYQLGARTSDFVVLADNDSYTGGPTSGVTPFVAIDSAHGWEGDTLAFVVTLSDPAEQPVTVDYLTTSGTATAGFDYASASGTLTFEPGQTEQAISVLTHWYQRTDEGSERFYVDLIAVSGAIPLDPRGVGTIVDTFEAPENAPSGDILANDQLLTTPESTPLAITLTATDPQGEPLIYILIAEPLFGTLSGDAPSFTYTPFAGYAGRDSFTFQATDGVDYSNVAEVSLDVSAAPAVIPAPLVSVVWQFEDAQVNEGETVYLYGSVAVENASFPATVRIEDALDGSLVAVVPVDSSGEFLHSVVIADDNPTGSAEDEVTWRIVAEVGGVAAYGDATFTVANVAPEVESIQLLDPPTGLPAAAIGENSVVELVLDVFDAGLADTIVVSVDWGDGGSVETVVASLNSDGVAQLVLTHQYLATPTPSPEGEPAAIRVIVSDDDTGSAFVAMPLTVAAAAPDFSGVTLEVALEHDPLVAYELTEGYEYAATFTLKNLPQDRTISQYLVSYAWSGAAATPHDFSFTKHNREPLPASGVIEFVALGQAQQSVKRQVIVHRDAPDNGESAILTVTKVEAVLWPHGGPITTHDLGLSNSIEATLVDAENTVSVEWVSGDEANEPTGGPGSIATVAAQVTRTGSTRRALTVQLEWPTTPDSQFNGDECCQASDDTVALFSNRFGPGAPTDTTKTLLPDVAFGAAITQLSTWPRSENGFKVAIPASSRESAEIPFTLSPDGLDENDETFTLTIKDAPPFVGGIPNTSSYAVGTRSATLTIVDDPADDVSSTIAALEREIDEYLDEWKRQMDNAIDQTYDNAKAAIDQIWRMMIKSRFGVGTGMRSAFDDAQGDVVDSIPAIVADIAAGVATDGIAATPKGMAIAFGIKIAGSFLTAVKQQIGQVTFLHLFDVDDLGDSALETREDAHFKVGDRLSHATNGKRRLFAAIQAMPDSTATEKCAKLAELKNFLADLQDPQGVFAFRNITFPSRAMVAREILDRLAVAAGRRVEGDTVWVYKGKYSNHSEYTEFDVWARDHEFESFYAQIRE